MRHEYAVYRYMGLKNVKGVAAVYGLFEDAANEALILVMSNVGKSLITQPSWRERLKVSLTEEEKYVIVFSSISYSADESAR